VRDRARLLSSEQLHSAILTSNADQAVAHVLARDSAAHASRATTCNGHGDTRQRTGADDHDVEQADSVSLDRLPIGGAFLKPENRSVDGSLPPLATINFFSFTDFESASFKASASRIAFCPRSARNLLESRGRGSVSPSGQECARGLSWLRQAGANRFRSCSATLELQRVRVVVDLATAMCLRQIRRRL
jgi:hypothetical protein